MIENSREFRARPDYRSFNIDVLVKDRDRNARKGPLKALKAETGHNTCEEFYKHVQATEGVRVTAAGKYRPYFELRPPEEYGELPTFSKSRFNSEEKWYQSMRKEGWVPTNIEGYEK